MIATAQQQGLSRFDPAAEQTVLLRDVYIPNLIAERGKQRSAEAWPRSILDTIRRHAIVLLEGEPGIGKSAFVHELSYWLANRPEPPLVPIRVSVRDVAANRSNLRDLLSRATKFGSADVGIPADEFADPPIEGQRWLILVDGLNQVLDESNRIELLTMIQAEVSSGPYYCLVTSRPLLPSEGLEAQAIGRYTMLPFGPTQTAEFARRWWSVDVETHDSGLDETHADDFLAAVQQHGLADLTSSRPGANPLTLALAAVIVKQWPVARSNGAVLLGRIVSALLEDEAGLAEAQQNFREAWSQVDSSTADAADQLFKLRPEILEHVAISHGRETAVTEYATAWLKQRKLITDVRGRSSAEAARIHRALRILLEDTRLITVRDRSDKFLNPALQDFLAGSCEVSRPERDSSLQIRMWKQPSTKATVVPKWLLRTADDRRFGLRAPWFDSSFDGCIIAALAIVSAEGRYDAGRSEAETLIRSITGLDNRAAARNIKRFTYRLPMIGGVLRLLQDDDGTRRLWGLWFASRLVSAGVSVDGTLANLVFDALLENVHEYASVGGPNKGLQLMSHFAKVEHVGFVGSKVADLVRDSRLPRSLRHEGVDALVRLADAHELERLVAVNSDRRRVRTDWWTRQAFDAYVLGRSFDNGDIDQDDFANEDEVEEGEEPHVREQRRGTSARSRLPVELRRMAAEGLLLLGHAATAVELMADRPAIAEDLRLRAAKNLLETAMLPHHYDRAISALVAIAANPGADQRTRSDASREYLRFARPEDLVRLAVTTRGSVDTSVREKAVDRLEELGRPSAEITEALMAIAHDAEVEVRARSSAAARVVALGGSNDEAFATLFALLTDESNRRDALRNAAEDPLVVVLAAHLEARTAPTGAVPGLVRLAFRLWEQSNVDVPRRITDTQSLFDKAQDDPDPGWRAAAALLIGMAEGGSKRAATLWEQTLREALSDTHLREHPLALLSRNATTQGLQKNVTDKNLDRWSRMLSALIVCLRPPADQNHTIDILNDVLNPG